MAPQPRFYFCLDFVLGREGGYSDHPADRGGATNCGVTQGLYDSVRAALGKPQRAVRLITEVEVRHIYEREFWRPPKCHLMTPPLDLLLFDSAVQHGAGRAAKLLQSVVGVFQDGAVGPKTMGAITEFERRKGVVGLVRVVRRAPPVVLRGHHPQRPLAEGVRERVGEPPERDASGV
jgi:lysozyme family protein